MPTALGGTDYLFPSHSLSIVPRTLRFLHRTLYLYCPYRHRPHLLLSYRVLSSLSYCRCPVPVESMSTSTKRPSRKQLRLQELAHQVWSFHVYSQSELVSHLDFDTLCRSQYIAERTQEPASRKQGAYPVNWDLNRPDLHKDVAEFLHLSNALPNLDDYKDWFAERLCASTSIPEPANPVGRKSSSRSRASSIASIGGSRASSVTPVENLSLSAPFDSSNPSASSSVPSRVPGEFTSTPPHGIADLPKTPITTLRTQTLRTNKGKGRASDSQVDGIQNDNMTTPGPSIELDNPSNSSIRALLLQMQEQISTRDEQFRTQLSRLDERLTTEAAERRRLAEMYGNRHDHQPLDQPPHRRRSGSGHRSPSHRRISTPLPPSDHEDPGLGHSRGNSRRESPHSRNGRGRPVEGGGYNWKTDEIGYLWPDCPDENVSAGYYKDGHKTYYQDVYLFVNHIRDIVDYKGEAMVKSNIQTCLMGSALRWYRTEVTDREKRLIRAMTLEDGWLTELVNRFKPDPFKALRKLNTIKYDWSSIRRGQAVDEFAQEILLHARGARIDNTFQQLSMIWERLDPDLRNDIPRPREDTTLSSFLRTLEEQMFQWKDRMAKRDDKRKERTARREKDNGRKGRVDQPPTSRPSWNPPGGRPWLQPRQPYQIPMGPYPQPYRFGANQYPRQLPWNQQALPQNQPPNGPPGLIAQPYGQRLPVPVNQQRQPWNRQPYQPQRPQQQPQQRAYVTDMDRTADESTGFTSNGASEDGYENPHQYDAYYGSQGLDDDCISQTVDPPDQDAKVAVQDCSSTDSSSDSDAWAVQLVDPSKDCIVNSVVVHCSNCHSGFTSNNKLHAHLPCQAEPSVILEVPDALKTSPDNVIVSTRLTEADAHHPDYLKKLRTSSSALANVGLNTIESLTTVCIDSGCSGTLMNEDAAKQIPNVDIRECEALGIKGIGSKHEAKMYATFCVYFPRIDPKVGQPLYGRITIRAQLVPDMQGVLLIGNEVMTREGIVIDPENGIGIVRSCESLVFPISCHSKPGRQPVVPVYTKTNTTVPPHSKMCMRVKHSGNQSKLKTVDKSESGHLMFDPKPLDNLILYAHLVDNDFEFVEVANETSNPVCIARHTHIGTVGKPDYMTAFRANADIADFARTDSEPVADQLYRSVSDAIGSNDYHRCVARDLVDAYTMSIDDSLSNTTEMTRVLSNGVTIYNEPDTLATTLEKVIMQYDVWANEDGSNVGVANIPESEWMEIPMRDGWERRLPKPKVYRLGPRDRELLDKTFEPLHKQGKMEYTHGHTPAGWPVFVVWKDVVDPVTKKHERKGRVVIDLRGANKEAIPDVYPVPRQEDILNMIRHCHYITVLDATKFFYQWSVRSDHRRRLAVISHRGQEVFNVAIMGFVNSVPYVQRRMDLLFKDLVHFCRAYIDDIVIASRTLVEHIDHLHKVLSRLQALNIKIEPKKAFVGFPSVQLLGLRVDGLGLITTEAKLDALKSLTFPRTLADLEHYLGITGCFRHRIEHYAQKSQALQDLKTSMLRGGPSKGRLRKAYTTSSGIEPTINQLEAFRMLQKHLTDPTILVHFDPDQQAYIDLDASRNGHGVVMYHAPEHMPSGSKLEPPPRTKVKPILFLSRLLKAAETRYWPTELEVSCLVWALHKVRHLVESATQPVIVFTDHASTVGLSTQGSLNTVAVEKLNLRLVRASQYIQQFRLRVCHRPGTTNIVADALSRLPRTNGIPKPSDVYLEADALLTAFPADSNGNNNHIAISLHLSNDFKDRVRRAYASDPRASEILTVLRGNNESTNPAVLPYTEDDGLLYMIKHVVTPRTTDNDDIDTNVITDQPWLYVPRTLANDIFHMVHDEQHHQGFEKCLAALDGITLYKGRKLLRDYLSHCESCLLNKVPRHRPYGDLQPIVTPPVPFDTVTLDFITDLPKINDLDFLLVIVDKFTKRVGLVPGKSTWSACDWGVNLLEYFQSHDWGMPRTFISDRDRRFTSDFMTGLHRHLKSAWHFTTAYHPQSDGQTERTIQTIEIMMRHSTCKGVEWVKLLPSLVASINGSVHASTGFAPHVLMYGIQLRQPWNLLKALQNPYARQDFAGPRLDAEEAIKFAAMHQKHMYDKHHQPISFGVDDRVLLRLHRGYRLPLSRNLPRKLQSQFVGPFRVVERVGRSAYRLDFPTTWKIHPVVSVAQLERYMNADPFGRQATHPAPVEGEDIYEIDRLVDKRVTRHGRGPYHVDYRVRWLGFGPDHDEWICEHKLNADDAIADYERNNPDVD